MDEIVAEEKALKDKLDQLDKQLEVQDREHRAIRRGWERKIEYEEDLIDLCKGAGD